ncbi:MAG TPA: response regulator transcription factor [Methylomirabilota bacterium]|nr:response regulator transcription factor [Methylomirabilota bacterium]
MEPPHKQPAPIRVTVVEDAADYRAHLVALVGGSGRFACVGAHPSAESALKHLSCEKPDVLLLDLELPGMAGEDSIGLLKQKLPTSEIIVLTLHDEPARIFKALQAGATGYLVKPIPPARLLEAILEVKAGGAPMSSPVARLVLRDFHQRGRTARALATLTPRESQILELLSAGHSSKEIADQLTISVRTVSTHLHHIYEKLHVASRSQAVARFFRH